MKKNRILVYSLISLLIGINSLSWSQVRKTSWRNEQINNEIKNQSFIKTFVYNYNGSNKKPLVKTEYDTSGYIISKDSIIFDTIGSAIGARQWRFKYHDHYNLKEETICHIEHNNTLWSTLNIWTYDSTQRLKKRIEWNTETNDTLTHLYSYNQQNNIVLTESITSFGHKYLEKINYQYDSFGNIVSDTIKNSIVSSRQYLYDKNHNLIKVRSNGLCLQEMTYDRFNRLIKLQNGCENKYGSVIPSLSSPSTTTFEYNKIGQKISESFIAPNLWNQKTQTAFEYYDNGLLKKRGSYLYVYK